jgi:hypothetical protein
MLTKVNLRVNLPLTQTQIYVPIPTTNALLSILLLIHCEGVSKVNFFQGVMGLFDWPIIKNKMLTL